jgi:homoserine trans-succinylase
MGNRTLIKGIPNIEKLSLENVVVFFYHRANFQNSVGTRMKFLNLLPI